MRTDSPGVKEVAVDAVLGNMGTQREVDPCVPNLVVLIGELADGEWRTLHSLLPLGSR